VLAGFCGLRKSGVFRQDNQADKETQEDVTLDKNQIEFSMARIRQVMLNLTHNKAFKIRLPGESGLVFRLMHNGLLKFYGKIHGKMQQRK